MFLKCGESLHPNWIVLLDDTQILVIILFVHLFLKLESFSDCGLVFYHRRPAQFHFPDTVHDKRWRI